MHQDMQLCGLLLHAHGCTNSPNTHGVKQQVWPLESGVISYAFTLYFHSTAQAPSVCLCRRPSLLFYVCVYLHIWERERESSVRQLYLHLYEQIPVGRAAEEHTSCLTYILYQAAFVCTVPWHTHTHTATHADDAFARTLRPFVGQGQQQGYLERPWHEYRPPMSRILLFFCSCFNFFKHQKKPQQVHAEPLTLLI